PPPNAVALGFWGGLRMTARCLSPKPRCAGIIRAAADGGKDERPDSSKAGRRILVVDDNRDGAKSLAARLKLLGNEVRTVHYGVAAVAMAGQFRPPAILMDVGMPKLNGLEATRRIHAEAWEQDLTIIALPGWGQENDRERSCEAGCDGQLEKPVNLPD